MLIGTAVIGACGAAVILTGGAGAGVAGCIAAGYAIKNKTLKGSKKAIISGAADGYMWGAITGAVTGGATSKNCFVAGTKILTENGHVNIEDIKIGDMVWAANPETGEKALKRVVNLFENSKNVLIHLTVKGEEIVTTEGHPFYVPEKG